MEDRIEYAKKLHTTAGCNCAQSVVVACHDILKVDEDTAFRISEGLGKGCAVETICGALTGCIMVISSYYSAGLEGHGSSKLHTYEMTKKYLEAFEAYDGSIICSELKGKRIKHESKDATCNDCIASAMRIMGEIIKE